MMLLLPETLADGVRLLRNAGRICLGFSESYGFLVPGHLFQRPVGTRDRRRGWVRCLAANSTLSEPTYVEQPEDRIAEIMNAIKKGERKYAGTPDVIDIDAGAVAEAAVATAAADTRILRTLEFCPDGVLAREILGELRCTGVYISATAYDAVIEAFAHRGALDDALSVFREMQDGGVAATDATYDALARPAARAGEYRFVERLYEAKAVDHNGGGIGPTSLAVLLEAYANGVPRQAGRAEAAFRGEMACAEERDMPATAAAGEQDGRVLLALLRAVGPTVCSTLCVEYGLDTSAVAGLI